VRDLWPELPKAMGVIKNKFILYLLGTLEKLAYRNAVACVGLSPGIVDGIKKHLPVNYTKPVRCIPNGCDLDLFKPVESKSILSIYPELVQKGLKSTDFIAVFSGTYGLANGLQALLDVGQELDRRGVDDIKLVMIGDGNQKAKLLQFKEAHAIKSCIFMDSLSKTRLAEILPHADLGLQILLNVPAFYFGTSPNKFFDYAAAGIPILINYPGWLANFVQEHEIGLYIEPDNAKIFADRIVEFAGLSDTERARMGNKSRIVAKEFFDREKLASQAVDLLAEIKI
jgi:glycosyltransferase involved in cell wall biosynthesis